MLIVKDSLEFLKEHAEYSTDIIYSDPPYGLGSEVIIRPDGKPDYSKASDFMNKWDMPTGAYWEAWFKEAFRVLKHGGHILMFAMPRQDILHKYYASLNGFVIKEPLWWYFISNFPKASDLSKNLDKNAGAKREVIGKQKGAGTTGLNENNNQTFVAKNQYEDGTHDITAPSTPLAKKYSGYKYSIAPLKQCVEEIMVFQKPYKTGSCMHDTLAYENGDKDCGCFALNIDGGRVPPLSLKDLNDIRSERPSKTSNSNDYTLNHGGLEGMDRSNRQDISGRYPAQTFISEEAAAVLDKQSGDLIGGVGRANRQTNGGGVTSLFNIGSITETEIKDIGGCSKILHTCKFEKGEYDLYMYCPKVGSEERNDGLDGFEYKSNMRVNAPRENEDEKTTTEFKNFHPTLKPISLNERILQLFKTPNPQKILYPFAGAGSEILGGLRAGFTDWQGCEINPEYVKIAEARLKDYLAQRKLSAFTKKEVI